MRKKIKLLLAAHQRVQTLSVATHKQHLLQRKRSETMFVNFPLYIGPPKQSQCSTDALSVLRSAKILRCEMPHHTHITAHASTLGLLTLLFLVQELSTSWTRQKPKTSPAHNPWKTTTFVIFTLWFVYTLQ